MPRDVGAFLAEQQRKAAGNSEVATEWGQLEELYNKKYLVSCRGYTY